MAELGRYRQYARHAMDLPVRVVIGEECREQVNPIIGHRLDGRMNDLSGGGARVVVTTFVPRAAKVLLEIPALGALETQHIAAQVMSTEMIDREPHYALGLRFAEDVGDYVDRLSTLDASSPSASEAGIPAVAPIDLGDNAPAWMTVLARGGVLDVQVLQEALAANKGDESNAAHWLTENGCVAPRDVALAQAEAADMAYVDPGEFRVHLENRKLIREEMARAHSIFPLFVTDRIITLAVARVLDLGVLDQIRLQTGCEVHCCLATARELTHVIEWAYGGFSESSAESATVNDLIWAEVFDDVSNAPVVKLVDVLLDRAANSRASDIHLDAEESTLRVRFRVDGVLREVPAPPKALLPAIVSRVKILSHLDIAETRIPQDGRFKFVAAGETLEVRVSTLPSANGEAVVLRLLRSGSRQLTLEELGMERQELRTFDRLLHQPHGMLLVTGPTGSGKTTTLYSGLTRLDRVRQSIITLEDPVEVRLPQVRQVHVNVKAGLTFENGLRAILRQDPDCVMLGEIRDRETAEIALQAALTGHIVLSTLHTNTAAGATTRLIDMGVPDFLVASSLIGVLAQRLCRRLCGHCARETTELPEGLEDVLAGPLGKQPHMAAVGCNRCGNTGYEGRVGIFELLVVDGEIRRAILEHSDEQAVAELARQAGMRTLFEDGVAKVRRHTTSLSELLRVAGHMPRIANGGRGGTGATGRGGTGEAFDVATYERMLSTWLCPTDEVAAVEGSA